MLTLRNSDPAQSEKPRNLRSSSFSLKSVKLLATDKNCAPDKKLSTSIPSISDFQAGKIVSTPKSDTNISKSSETRENFSDNSVKSNKSDKMNDDAVITLLRQTVTQVQDLYDQRPITVISAPTLNSFSADGDSNWTEWERQFSNVSILAGANQLERKLALLSTYLKGAAQTFYYELQHRTPRLATWEDWVRELAVKFPDNQHIDIKRDQMMTRYQLPTESVQQFASDIRRLARRAQPGWTGHDENDFVKSHFISKLLPSLRLWVRNASPKTFEDAVIEAFKQEVNQNYDNAHTVQTTPNLASSLNPVLSAMSGLSVHGNPHSFHQPTNMRSNPTWRLPQNPTYHSVNSNNNFSPRFADRSPRFPNYLASQSRTANGTIICYYCNKPGHLQNVCRTRLSQENYNRNTFRPSAQNRFQPQEHPHRFQARTQESASNSYRPPFSQAQRTNNTENRYNYHQNTVTPSRNQVRQTLREADTSSHAEDNGSYPEQDSEQTENTENAVTFDPFNCNDPDLLNFYAQDELPSMRTNLVFGSDPTDVDGSNSFDISMPEYSQISEGGHHEGGRNLSDTGIQRISSEQNLQSRAWNAVNCPTPSLGNYFDYHMLRFKILERLRRKGIPAVYSCFSLLAYCKIIWLLLLYICLIDTSGASEPYNMCGTHRNGHALSIPTNVPCILPETLADVSSTLEVSVWAPRQKPVEINAAKCYTRTRTICTNYGFFGSKGIVSDSSEQKPVSIEDCSSANKTKLYNSQTLIKLNKHFWSTNNTLSVKFKWCCSDHCFSQNNFILEIGIISSYDGNLVLSDLGDTGGCWAQSGYCMTPLNTIIWPTTNFRSVCQYTKTGTYTARMLGNYITIEKIQGAFTVRRRTKFCNLSNTYKTAQGVLVQLYNHSQPVKSLDLHLDFDLNISQLENDPVNAKLQFLFTKIQQFEMENFRSIWKELCRSADRYLQLIWQILYLDPTVGARALLKRNNIHASFAGEALVIWECTSILPDHVYWNYTVDASCYQFLPISYNNQTWFVIPGSRDLTHNSPTVDCSERILGFYKEDNLWRTDNGLAHITHFSLEITWHSNWSTYTFDAAPLFHDYMTQENFQAIGLIRNYMFKTTMIENQLQRVMNYTASLSLNPNVVAEFLKGTGEFLLDASKSIGNSFERIIITGTSNILSTADKLLTGPFQFVINIVVITLILFVSLYVGMWCIRLGVCPKCIPTRNKTIEYSQTDKLFKHSSISGHPHDNTQPSHSRENIEMTCINSPDTVNVISEPSEHKPTRLTELLGKAFEPLITKSDLTVPKTCNMGLDTPYIHKDRCPMITAILSNYKNVSLCKKVYGLIDTGSEITIVNESIQNQLALPLLKSTIKSITLAGGQRSEVKGLVWLNLQFLTENGYTPPHLIQAQIVKNCPIDFLIGTDYLCKFNSLHFFWKKGIVQYGNFVLSLVEPLYLPSEHRGLARLTKNVHIGSRSMVMAPLTVTKPYNTLKNLIFEPHPDQTLKHSVFVSSVIDSPKNDEIYVSIINARNVPMTLYAGTNLGNVRLYNDTLLTPVNAAPVSKQNKCLEISEIPGKPMLEELENSKLLKLLQKFSHLFVKDDQDLGRTPLTQHTIYTGDAQPVKQQPYRIAHKQRETIDSEIQMMLDKDIIRPSSSPWASPVVLVPKKTGGYRFCVDYRKLNAVTKKDNYPLPRIDDILDTLNNSVYFTTLDQAWGYWQIPLSETDREKTAFITYNGLYEFNVLPFGLCNAPATFQRLMNLLLAGLQWNTCLVYLDDILIFSKTFEDHIQRLELILHKLESAGLKLRLEKCKFMQTETSYLGYIISSAGIQPDPAKIKSVKEFPIPKSAEKVKSFLGLAGYYRRFIKNFSSIAEPLLILLRKNAKFVWTQECQSAFEKLKTFITEAPILIYPDFTKPFLVLTDASGKGLGAILAQVIDEKEHPIAYISRSLKPAEQNYPVFEQEALAVVWAVKQFRTYLYQHKAIIVTDHAALQYILKKPNPSPRIARWGLALQEYDLEIRHRPGKNHGNVDALSRLCSTVQTKATKDCSENNENLADSYISRKQADDPFCRSMIDFLTLHKIPDDQGTAHTINNLHHHFSFCNNTLLYTGPPSNKTLLELVVVPSSLKHEIMHAFHDDILSGHLGFKRTYCRIRERFYWVNLYKDVNNYCTACKACNTRKPPSRTTKALMTPIPVGGPFDRVATDVMGPLPLTERGNKYIIVFTDYLTKFCMTAALPNITAQSTAAALMNEVILRHGAPKELLSDQGTNFLSSLVAEICKLCDTRKINTTPYHPQTDGLVERFNKTLASMLAMYINKKHNDWDVFLPSATFAYNTAKQESTQFSPFYLLYAREPSFPIDTVLQFSPSKYTIDLTDYITELKTFLHEAWSLAKIHIISAQTSQKFYHDRNVHSIDLEPGNTVYKHNPALIKGQTAKFSHPWTGPYVVLKVSYPNVLIQSIDKKTQPELIHMNRLKLARTGHLTQNNNISSLAPISSAEKQEKSVSHHDYNLRSKLKM